MKHQIKRVLFGAVTVSMLSSAVCWAADKPAEAMPEMPQPTKEHAWLQQFVGDWKAESDLFMEPGKPPVHTTGTEEIEAVGEFWTVSEIESTMMDKPFTGNMTLGFDTAKKKFVGTWIDSMTGKLWEYEGTVDATGKVLTLNSEGECPMNPGKLTQFKEVLELKDENTKTFTSSMLDENGKWVTVMTSTATRVADDSNADD
ncbi:MAG: DUF1579 domain-containing protein [Vampirovibrionales bacterium]|nr:DUF1579 domain-containing protein [Vampirovibrionales bacterium]